MKKMKSHCKLMLLGAHKTLRTLLYSISYQPEGKNEEDEYDHEEFQF